MIRVLTIAAAGLLASLGAARADAAATVMDLCTKPLATLPASVAKFTEAGWQPVTNETLPEVADLMVEATLLRVFQRDPLPEEPAQIAEFVYAMRLSEVRALKPLLDDRLDMSDHLSLLVAPDGTAAAYVRRQMDHDILCSLYSTGPQPSVDHWGVPHQDLHIGYQNTNPNLVTWTGRRTPFDADDPSRYFAEIELVVPNHHAISSEIGIEVETSYVLTVSSQTFDIPVPLEP